MLGPARDFGFDAGVAQRLPDLLLGALDVLLAIQSFRGEPRRHLLVVVRLQIAKTQVFQFPFKLPDAQAIGERRVDFACFERNALTLLFGQGLCGAQPVQLVCQLDEHQPHVGNDREQHLAQRFGLRWRQRLSARPMCGSAKAAQLQQFASNRQG